MLCLAAARLASRRVAPGPPAVLCLLLALPRCGRGQGRGPASASLAAAFGTAQLTPLSVCALEDCLFHGLLGVASAVSFPGAVRRRAMPSLVGCCSGRADGCQEHALGFPMARHGGTLR